ncbi:ribosome small subunit-dependent GTPase A [Facilibium subflavum]|uniref:ribosome small subunit-dependent GTPase A n=1 Tax=Facilibium subflavum TaxID=2219058 RepID=UPI000E649125|nr:ribosome small subunit-dependent GTPase A [Facilibium subflavum]
MGKRRLSKQQLRNIKHKQQTQLVQSPEGTILLDGVVIAHFGKRIQVEDSEGKTILCKYRQNIGDIVAGDKVLWQQEPNHSEGIIYQVLPRTNILKRPSKLSKKTKSMAANIDQLVIMLAVEPAPIEHYIDRYLVAAHHMNIHPVIVINKIDLLNRSDNKAQIADITHLYQTLGYEVYHLSAITHDKFDKLKSMLSGKTSIFVGQSGVGKSETLNALLGQIMAKTGDISAHNKRGKHTTTTACLYHLDTHTHIIDSPGIREFGIWHLTEEDIFNGFKEFHLSGQTCQFRNCAHLKDTKGCVIDQALKEGKITPQRFINYHRLIQEITSS